MVRRLLVLVLIALGFAAGVYVGVTMTRSKPSPETIEEPALPARSPAGGDTRRVEPIPPPANRSDRSRAPATKSAATPAATTEPAAAAPTAGILNIDSDVPGAQVFIDREFVGAAPVVGKQITPGTHRINVSASGFEGVAETVEVSPGPRNIVIKLREVRLNASLEAVHKHRIGSCKGRLIATPRGLRYETTEKDDAFATSLRDIESFEVDYLKKNLKVKLKKGKTYDFTDPDGNADRLFVFHRDVEHARERLNKGDQPATK